MRGWGPVRRSILIVGLAISAFALSACNEPESAPAGYRQNLFGGRPLKLYASPAAFVRGGLYRTIDIGSFRTATEVRPMCTKDFSLVLPTPVAQDYDLPEVDIMIDPAVGDNLLKADHPSLPPGRAIDFIESVRLQLHGVTRELVDDSEIYRVHRALGQACLGLIRYNIQYGHTVFFVDGVVIAKQIKMTVQLKDNLPGSFDPARLSVNGLKVQSVEKNTVVLAGWGMIVEVFHKTLGDD